VSPLNFASPGRPAFENAFKEALFKTFVVKLRVKEETWGDDNASRVKTSVVGIVDVDSDIAASRPVEIRIPIWTDIGGALNRANLIHLPVWAVRRGFVVPRLPHLILDFDVSLHAVVVAGTANDAKGGKKLRGENNAKRASGVAHSHNELVARRLLTGASKFHYSKAVDDLGQARDKALVQVDEYGVPGVA
jgi:hypothetical protein